MKLNKAQISAIASKIKNARILQIVKEKKRLEKDASVNLSLGNCLAIIKRAEDLLNKLPFKADVYISSYSVTTQESAVKDKLIDARIEALKINTNHESIMEEIQLALIDSKDLETLLSKFDIKL
ncbi:MAG TPA: hypothetical protein VI815_02390 [Candidatus Nanoarchaeia archaeon]|nr:hypothetical protein [Candidatus Nanoarchaeia archaeon]